MAKNTETVEFMRWLANADQAALETVIGQISFPVSDFGHPRYSAWDETRHNLIARRLGRPEHKTDLAELDRCADRGTWMYDHKVGHMVQTAPPGGNQRLVLT